jgi:hypothetical protein
MPRVTVTYDEVKATGTRRGVCKACGLRMIKQQTFTNTVNPFNKNPDGSVRTYDEVLARVRAEAAAWRPEFLHAKCER